MSRLDLSKLSEEEHDALHKLDHITNTYCNKLQELITHLQVNNTDTISHVKELETLAARHKIAVRRTHHLIRKNKNENLS